MTRLNQVALYLMNIIDSKCNELTLKDFPDDDFILAEDAYENNIYSPTKGNNYPAKFIDKKWSVLKRTLRTAYDVTYTKNLEIIIENMLKEK